MKKKVAQLRITFVLVEENAHQHVELKAQLLKRRPADADWRPVAEAEIIVDDLREPGDLNQTTGMIASELHPWVRDLLAEAGLQPGETPALLQVVYVGDDVEWAMGPLREALQGTANLICIPRERLVENLGSPAEVNLIILDEEEVDLLEVLVGEGYKVAVARRPTVTTIREEVMKRGALECFPKMTAEALRKEHLVWVLSAAGLRQTSQG